MHILAITVVRLDSHLQFAARKGVLNVIDGVLCDICRFRAMTLSPIHLVVNWPVLTIYILGITNSTNPARIELYTIRCDIRESVRQLQAIYIYECPKLDGYSKLDLSHEIMTEIK